MRMVVLEDSTGADFLLSAVLGPSGLVTGASVSASPQRLPSCATPYAPTHLPPTCKTTAGVKVAFLIALGANPYSLLGQMQDLGVAVLVVWYTNGHIEHVRLH